MAGLTDTTIAASYDQLLIVDRDGGGNGTTHVTVKDGDGDTTFPVTLATDAIMITSTNRLEFGDDASYIHQSADGVLDLVSDTEIELTATTIDINGAVTVTTATNYAMTIKSTDTDAADIFRVIADDDGALLTLSKDASDDAELYLYDGSGNANVQISGNNVSYFNGGNVGIGNTSPIDLLDLRTDPAGTGQPGAATTGADANNAIRITSTGNAINEKVGIAFGGYTGYVHGGIYGVGTGQSNNTIGDITFDLRASDSDTTFTEVMRLKAGGNVGIGIASPESVLNLKTTKTVALSSMAHFLTLGLTIDDSTAYDTEGGGGGIAFRTGRNSSGTQTIYAAIDGAKEGTANDGYTGALRFYTNNNSTGVPTEHMRITSGGNVGIGTTSPGDYSTSADNLVVYDSAHAGITIVSANNKSGNLFFSDGTSGSEQYRGYLQYDHGNTLTDFLLIGTAGTEAIRIDASQNVAIGNGKSPGALLDIAYQGNDDYPVKIRGNIDNDGGFTGIKFGYEADTGNYEKCAIKVEGTSGNVQPNFHILLNSAASSADVSTDNTDAKFTILNGGNVGIGETSPDSLLHISGVGDNNHCITMDQSGRKNAIGNFYSSGSTLSQMQFYMSNGNTDGSANVRMRLFSGGELLVNRDSSPGGVINSNTMDGRWGIVVDDTYGNDAFIDFRDAGNSIGNITIVSGNVSYNTFIGSHYSSLTTDNEDNIEIGTVLSTIDETHTRHLAKFKISDAVGDTRVYGVFAGWDKMHEGEGSQATVSGLGATQVRVTGACQGGDLLESNGDGTAKVQSDDIIRSKTIGKVTIGDSDTSVKLVSCVLYCG